MSDEKNNTGNWSTGDRSTGDRSTGDWSTGDRSTGDWSTGCGSTGYGSSGYGSTGDRSTGDRSTGYWSTGDWSISKFSTGNFSTIDYDGYGAFNKKCTKKEWGNADKPNFLYFDLTEWVVTSDMTDDEKSDNPLFESAGGYLKEYGYQEAFSASWEKASDEDKALLLKLPNFDAEIFKEISGIDVNKKPDELIIIGGNNYLKQDIENALKDIKSVD